MSTAGRVEVTPGWGQSESVWQPRRAAFWLFLVLTGLGILFLILLAYLPLAIVAAALVLGFRTTGPFPTMIFAGLVAASDQPSSRLCMACFDGSYPIPIPDVVGKHILEGIERTVVGTGREPDHAEGYAGTDALRRP